MTELSLLDAVGIYDAATISFLSGCTVLSMSAYSVVRSKLEGQSRIDKKIGFPLALGAAAGGLIGKKSRRRTRGTFMGALSNESFSHRCAPK